MDTPEAVARRAPALTESPMVPHDAVTECVHCGTPVPPEMGGRFCCTGCEAVYGLLRERGLTRYYDLQGNGGAPVASSEPGGRDLKWLEAYEARLNTATGPTSVTLDIQGLHCAACVWLLDELFARQQGGLRVVVNPALGRAEMLVDRTFPLRAYVTDVERFGYMFGPPLKLEHRASRGLATRIGVCAALALNAMIFALPLYLGLSSGPIHTLFRVLAFALSAGSVAVGGTVFIASAARATRRGVISLDLPIALGIVLAFAGSAWAFVAGRDGGAYFDTVAVFITLMLTGRWLQERVLERNRRYLLASDGVDGLLARRVRGGAVTLVRCGELSVDDMILVAPGDVVPVESVLQDEQAACSLDWISGESAPRSFARGETVPAGAFNAGTQAILVRAQTAFAESPLVTLLQSPAYDAGDVARATPWWQRFAGAYVIAVLALAASGFALWFARTGDPRRAMDVATAVLVVTCPCAFGIAAPMAYELVLAGLRRAGLFVRSASFLDRAVSVRRVVFDKTGTLTTGTLRLANPEALVALTATERSVLFNLAVRSTHPKSAAVRRALGDAMAFGTGLEVQEHAGAGLSFAAGEGTYRLGRGEWAAPGKSCDGFDLVFSLDGRVLAALRTEEVLRPDARAEIAELEAAGHEVWVLSGDSPLRVRAMAEQLGVPAERAVGGCSPEDKERWLAAHDHSDTLMVGDGINDALAVRRAFCSGTPAIDRPFMPARTDFYVVTAGLRPVGLALRASHALARVHKRNLCAALAYNALTVALALAGRMSPLLCAVLMPASSLAILFATVASLSARSPLWRSWSCKSS